MFIRIACTGKTGHKHNVTTLSKLWSSCWTVLLGVNSTIGNLVLQLNVMKNGTQLTNITSPISVINLSVVIGSYDLFTCSVITHSGFHGTVITMTPAKSEPKMSLH